MEIREMRQVAKCENCGYIGKKNESSGGAWTAVTCPKCGYQWFRWRIA